MASRTCGETISHPGQVGLPTFSVNDGSDASQTVATLYGLGTYTFRVMMDNGTMWPGHADVSVIINQSLGSVVVTPLLAIANPGDHPTFSAQALDQFGLPMATQPTFAWSVVGGSGSAGGTISSAGVYTRPSSVTGTPSDLINVTATVGGITRTGIASVTVPAVAAAAPTIATAPTATPVNQTQIRLTVLGGNPGGVESDLIYVWSATNLPTGAAAPSFSANGTNSAKTVIVTCDSAYPLNYTFSVTIQNRQGMTVSQSVTIADNQTFTKVVITPQQSSIGVNRQVSYTAQAQDQYSRAMASQPSFSWSVTDTSNTVLHTGNGASFAYTPAVSGAQQVTATATVGSIQLTVQAGLTVISLGPSIRQIVSIAGNDDGSPQTIGSDMPVTIISYNPDGTSAPWALWLIPTGGGGDGTGGGPVLLASGTQSAGQPGAPQQVATVGPTEESNGNYTLILTQSTTDYTDAVADTKSIEIENSRLTLVANSTTWVTLSWPDLGENTQYFIFRSDIPNFQPSPDNEIGTTTVTRYEDGSVIAAHAYYYQVYTVSSSAALPSLIGQACVSTPAQDGPYEPIGAIMANLIATPQADGGDSPGPTGLTAEGVNDLEIILHWQNNCKNVSQFLIEESLNGVSWNVVGSTDADATTYLVRGSGPSGTNFLQEHVTYYFRIELPARSGDSNTYDSNVQTAHVVIPTFDNTIIIVGGFLYSESYLEESWFTTDAYGNHSVGDVWTTLADKGYNVFITADPIDGGVVNKDGSGRIYDELQEEINRGWGYDVGLIGYSHGGGTIFNISNRLFDDSSALTGDGLLPGVVFSATIDAVMYGTTLGFARWSTLHESPSERWGGGAEGVNYWEPNGATATYWWWPGKLDVNGAEMPNITNREMISDTHQNIGTDPFVLHGVETATKRAFDELSF